MAVDVAQLEQFVARGQAAGEASDRALKAAARARKRRLDLLRLLPKLEWWLRDDSWDAMQRREHICIWPGLYRLRVWRLGPPGGPWGWELQTLSGAVLRSDVVRRKRDAKAAAVKATEAAIRTEREQLEREGVR
jgi:hypothetical protein